MADNEESKFYIHPWDRENFTFIMSSVASELLSIEIYLKYTPYILFNYTG